MAGVYVHIPFCKSRCRYCDFFSTTLLNRREEYIDALLAEAETRRDEIGINIPTLYFGGGTPSLMKSEQIERLLTAIIPCREEAAKAEITLEANPGDLTFEKLSRLRQSGINRLSVGIQSFSDERLILIGRRHTRQEAIEAVQMAQKAGFDNISIDLIYGLPGQTMEEWESDVEQALRLEVQHISSYCLSYEEGTALTQMLLRGEITETDEDTENAMYDYLCERLKQAGYEHYEISNWALPTFRSRHNSSYWKNAAYVGLGAGAHSYDGITRSWNPNDLNRYIQESLAHSLQRESETLSNEERHTEQIMLGLRTQEGIDSEWVKNRQDRVNHYVEQGLLTYSCADGSKPSHRLCATQQGIHILNRIIQDLI